MKFSPFPFKFIISPEDLILYIFFIKQFLSVSKISKNLVFFLRKSSEYLTRYGQGSVEITNPCLYFFEYSPDIPKNKTKVLDIFNTDKKCFMKINIESSPPEIWIRIRFLEINGSPSLVYSIYDIFSMQSLTNSSCEV